MEDRYLFKAKRIDNGEWVQGYYAKGLDVFNDCEEAHIIFEPNTAFYSSGETDGWHKVDPSTICQCTGLKDKNGKRVWENDIVNAITSNNLGEPVYIKDIVVVTNDYKLMFGLDFSNELECVGNIFNNPELLESEG